jgi:ATP-dependent DNA helicase RecG
MFTKREEIAQRAQEFLDKVKGCPPCQLEGQTLEVKGWCSCPKELSQEIGEAAVCLANADGGIVVIGVSNRHTAPACFRPCGHPEVSPDWVEERVGVLTRPPVVCRAFSVKQLLPHLGDAPQRDVIVLDVPKTSSVELHKFQGVCYKRKDDKCPVEYSTSADDFSDMVIPNTGLDDIDHSTLSRLMEHSPISSRYGMGEGDFLRKAELTRTDSRLDPDRELLTVGGLLLLGKPTSIAKHMPHAQVAFTYQGVSGISDGGRTETLNIFEAVRRFTQQLQDEIELDSETLHEVVANALIHRDYRPKAVTEIIISPEDVTFQNPGTLLAGLTPRNLLRAHPIYRNFRLAEAARQAGLCRKFGDGIDRIFYNCLSAGYDFPFIDVDPDSFRIKFSRSANTAFAKMLRARAQTLDNLDKIIVVKCLQVKGTATLNDLALALQRPSLESDKILTDMAKINIIEPSVGGYRLAPTVIQDIKSFEPEKTQLGFWPNPAG